MGTSANNPGPNSRSPLVPPHADSSPGAPLPPRPEHGLRQFRNSLSRWTSSHGGRTGLQKVAASYVGGALGGATTGARRFGTVTSSSAQAISGLAGLVGLASVAPGTVNSLLADAIGRPIEEAASIIARAVAPENSESDHVIAVIQDAIIEAFEETGNFELETITEDFLDSVLESALIEMIFHDMAERIGGSSLDKAATPSERQARENELHDFISEMVAQQLATFPNSPRSVLLGEAAITNFQRDCIVRVLQAWEE